MSIIKDLKKDIQVLQAKIEEIQEGCCHPEAAVIRIVKADTDNWCKSDKRYWYSCECKLCEKRWTEPQ